MASYLDEAKPHILNKLTMLFELMLNSLGQVMH